MSLPKKLKKNLDIKRVDPQGGPKEWVNQFLEQNKTFLPRSVDHADLDKGFIEFVDKELDLVVGGEKVPVQFMSSQRWAEFARGWKNSDKYKNLKIPFISVVRKPNAQQGTNPADYKIPVRKTFSYVNMPVWDGNKKGVDIYKIPNPVGVDLTFTVRLFSYKMRQLNEFNKKVLQTFASAQAYVNIKGHYFPIMLESIGDDSTMDSIDAKRYYVQTYEMKLMGYIVDEEEFEITPAITRAFVAIESSDKSIRPISKVISDDRNVKYIIQFLEGSTTESDITIWDTVTLNTINTTNVLSYEIYLNNVLTTLPINVSEGDKLTVAIIKVDTNSFSEIEIVGEKTSC